MTEIIHHLKLKCIFHQHEAILSMGLGKKVSDAGMMAWTGGECKCCLLKMLKCRADNGAVVTQDSSIQRIHSELVNWLPSFAPTLITHFHLGIRQSQPPIAPHTSRRVMILHKNSKITVNHRDIWQHVLPRWHLLSFCLSDRSKDVGRGKRTVACFMHSH